jgi:ActR/RegA family two-component response regulator
MNKADNTKFSPIRLLLVDDEDEFRQTIAKRLARRGLVANQVADGAECLSWLEKKALRGPAGLPTSCWDSSENPKPP